MLTPIEFEARHPHPTRNREAPLNRETPSWVPSQPTTATYRPIRLCRSCGYGRLTG